jgi:hypothetical protein
LFAIELNYDFIAMFVELLGDMAQDISQIRYRQFEVSS